MKGMLANPQSFALNPVLVVAGDTIIGLTVMRSLGRRGVPVYCARTLDDALGPRSAYCMGSFWLPKKEEPAIAAILEHARRWKVTHLIGISEPHIALLNRHRDQLEREFVLLFPPPEVFRRATHKNLTLECARSIGVSIPETAYPQSMEDLETCRRLRFPVILKMSHHEFPPGTKVFQHKALRVETIEDLRRVLGQLPPGQFPMVQEYIPGGGSGVSMLIRNGKTVLAFQHRRLRESPPEGGIGIFCEAMPLDPKLLDQSEMLLARMGWEGVAMVEYRGDPETARYTLMEVNGRFWGSLPTALHAGADFPFWLYATSFPAALPPPTLEYQLGLRARSLAGDTKWLLSVLRGRKESAAQALGQYLAGFHPSTRYFKWAWDDPKPPMMNFLGRFWRR